MTSGVMVKALTLEQDVSGSNGIGDILTQHRTQPSMDHTWLSHYRVSVQATSCFSPPRSMNGYLAGREGFCEV